MPVGTAQKYVSSAIRDPGGEEIRGGRGGATAGDGEASTTDRRNREEGTAHGWKLPKPRQRSRSVSQCGTQQAAGDSAKLRKRARSSSSPSCRSGDGVRRRQLAILGEVGDISALSVELAVADKKSGGQKTSYNPLPRHRRLERSKSICVGASASDRGLTRHGSKGASGGYYFSFSQERSRRSLTQVEPACFSGSDESEVETAGDNDGLWTHHSPEHYDFFAKQYVVRPHRQQRSVPSIVQLFKLKPVSSSEALAAAARCRRSSITTPQSPGVQTDDSAPQSPVGVPGGRDCEGGDDVVGFGSDDERLANQLADKNAARQSRTSISTHHEGTLQIDSPHRYHRRRDSNESTTSPIQPWAGAYPPYRDGSLRRDDWASSSMGASGLPALFDAEQKSADTEVDEDAVTADENKHRLRSARAKEKLVLGQRFGERFGTTGVKMSSGSRSAVDFRVHGRQVSGNSRSGATLQTAITAHSDRAMSSRLDGQVDLFFFVVRKDGYLPHIICSARSICAAEK